MKCWNCGSENSPSKKYCNSCASLLADPRKKEQLDVSAGQLILAIMRMIGRELARSAMAYIGLIGVVAAIVLISDLITGSRLMAEIGRILVIIGGFMMLISVLSIHRIPEKLVLAIPDVLLGGIDCHRCRLPATMMSVNQPLLFVALPQTL